MSVYGRLAGYETPPLKPFPGGAVTIQIMTTNSQTLIALAVLRPGLSESDP